MPGDPRAGDRRRRRLRSIRRPSAHRRRELDPGPRCPLPARRRRHQPLSGPAHRRPLVRRDGLVGRQPSRAAAQLLPHVRAGGNRGSRRIPGAGPDPLRPLLRPDADPVLLPLRELGDRASWAAGGGRGSDPPATGGDQDDRVHAGGIAADAGRGDRGRDPYRKRRADRLQHPAPCRASAGKRQPVLDLLVLRRGLPGEDARVPAARLDARRLSGGAAAGPRALFRGALQGRRLRVPADRPTDLPRGDQPLPGGDPADRGRLDPLRVGDGLHADQRAADPRLLLRRAARLHHPWDLQPAPRRRGWRGHEHGQPRARDRAADADRRPAGRPDRHRRHHQDGRPGAAGARARRPVPDRNAGAAGDARLRQLHRRVLHPQRDLPGEDRLRLRRRDRHRVGRLLRAAPLPARDAQPQARRDRIARDRLARGRRRRWPRGVHHRDRPLSRTDPAPGRPLGARTGRGHSAALPADAGGRAMNFNAPHIDYSGLSPVIALTAGVVVVLLVGLLPRVNRFTLASLTIAVLAVAAARCIIEWSSNSDLVAGALRLDAFGLSATLIACTAAAIVVLLAIREPAAEEAGHGAFYALLLGSVLGMALIAQAQNLVAFFVALELLSIPLYVLSASARRQERSLESGLKYLIIGSIGSATVLYGFALLYGASGSTDFSGIAHAVGPGGKGSDTLVLIGTAMVATGLAFKTSLAPFHQWTPDVYQGAPTPVTAFMAVATKAAAFIALARLFEVALGPIAHDWKPALAAIAVISIVVGNIGALGQDSLKRLMGYSGIAQAGYMLAGIVVATETGLEALVFYLAAYTLMNLAVFAVIVARERETDHGDGIDAIAGIGRSRPLLAWPLTIGMLALAGLPGTSGFMGKLFLIEATVDGDYTWLGGAIVIGTMVSLAYYLRVIAAVWMWPEPSAAPPPAQAGAMPAIAGGSPEADAVPRGAS